MTGLRDKRKAVESPLVRRPPPVAGDDSTTISYVLRNSQVVVPCTGSPTASHYNEIETEEEPEYAPSRQTPTCAQLGLEHYNSVNQGGEHELVKPVESNAFIFNGVWIHANFLAKPIGATSVDDLAPKYFLAELKGDHVGLSCISCVKMGPGVPKKLGGCGVCPRQIIHPDDGGYWNAQPFNDSATAKSCVFTF